MLQVSILRMGVGCVFVAIYCEKVLHSRISVGITVFRGIFSVADV
jgi:hypothetical protein